MDHFGHIRQLKIQDENGQERFIDDLEYEITESYGQKICAVSALSAVWEDTGQELSESDLEHITESHQTWLLELAYENQ